MRQAEALVLAGRRLQDAGAAGIVSMGAGAVWGLVVCVFEVAETRFLLHTYTYPPYNDTHTHFSVRLQHTHSVSPPPPSPCPAAVGAWPGSVGGRAAGLPCWTHC